MPQKPATNVPAGWEVVEDTSLPEGWEVVSEQAPPKTPVAPGVISQFLGGMVKEVPALIGGAFTGSARALMHPVQTVQDVLDLQADQFRQAGEAWKEGRHAEVIGRSLAGSLPLIGPAAAYAGEELGSGEPERMGLGTTNALAMVLSGSPAIRGVTRRGVRTVAKPVTDFTKAAVPVGPMIRRGNVLAGKTLTKVAENPLLSAGTGAALGYTQGGIVGALFGLVGGGAGPRVLQDVLKAHQQSRTSVGLKESAKAIKELKRLDPTQTTSELSRIGRRTTDDVSLDATYQMLRRQFPDALPPAPSFATQAGQATRQAISPHLPLAATSMAIDEELLQELMKRIRPVPSHSRP